jgi:hypothetical protein
MNALVIVTYRYQLASDLINFCYWQQPQIFSLFLILSLTSNMEVFAL